MDVGPHFQTHAIHQFFGGEVIINTLGWYDERLVSEDSIAKHFQFDLNNAKREDRWPDTGLHDIVVMAEVVEHLYTSPLFIFKLLKGCMKAGGYLIVQTPNAADLTKRMKLALGVNPYELIREDQSNPGHFREYTADELQQYFNGAGLQTEDIKFCDYWPHSGIRRILEQIVPSFKRGITAVARKQ